MKKDFKDKGKRERIWLKEVNQKKKSSYMQQESKVDEKGFDIKRSIRKKKTHTCSKNPKLTRKALI